MTIKIDHINLSAANLKQSMEWYKRVFGFEMVESGTTPQGVKWSIVALNDFMICMRENEGRANADQVEDKSAHRIYHFGLRVSDLENWREKIEKYGLKLYYGGEVEYPSSRSWYIHDPAGHEIEVSYTADESLQF